MDHVQGEACLLLNNIKSATERFEKFLRDDLWQSYQQELEHVRLERNNQAAGIQSELTVAKLEVEQLQKQLRENNASFTKEKNRLQGLLTDVNSKYIQLAERHGKLEQHLKETKVALQLAADDVIGTKAKYDHEASILKEDLSEALSYRKKCFQLRSENDQLHVTVEQLKQQLETLSNNAHEQLSRSKQDPVLANPSQILQSLENKIQALDTRCNKLQRDKDLLKRGYKEVKTKAQRYYNAYKSLQRQNPTNPCILSAQCSADVDDSFGTDVFPSQAGVSNKRSRLANNRLSQLTISDVSDNKLTKDDDFGLLRTSSVTSPELKLACKEEGIANTVQSVEAISNTILEKPAADIEACQTPQLNRFPEIIDLSLVDTADGTLQDPSSLQPNVIPSHNQTANVICQQTSWQTRTVVAAGAGKEPTNGASQHVQHRAEASTAVSSGLDLQATGKLQADEQQAIPCIAFAEPALQEPHSIPCTAPAAPVQLAASTEPVTSHAAPSRLYVQFCSHYSAHNANADPTTTKTASCAAPSSTLNQHLSRDVPQVPTTLHSIAAVTDQPTSLAVARCPIGSTSEATAPAAPPAASGLQRRSHPSASTVPYKHQEVVRKKADREALQGFECLQCKAFYEALSTWGTVGDMPKCGHVTEGDGVTRDQLRQMGSRHRYKHAPPPTPAGFWDMGFNDSLDSRLL